MNKLETISNAVYATSLQSTLTTIHYAKIKNVEVIIEERYLQNRVITNKT